MDHPEKLRVRTWVDDELRQDGNTDDFIYSIGQMIEELTTVFTLEPGDILATGTPSGVGAAFRPPRFLKIGQTVKVEIEGPGPYRQQGDSRARQQVWRVEMSNYTGEMPKTARERGKIAPYKMGHIAVRTSRLEEMLDWYCTVLEAKIAFRNEDMGFITYDDEHHRLAIIKMPGLEAPPEKVTGMEQVSFTYESMGEF